MSRLLSWLKRELPACSARYVEVRDGDDTIGRYQLQRGGSPEELADEIESLVDSQESRSVQVVAILRGESDGPCTTMTKRAAGRSERSAAGLVGVLMRENEQLRTTLREQTEQVLRAVLQENKRLSEANANLEQRRMDTVNTLEELLSLKAERDLAIEELRMRDERAKSALGTLKNDLAPKLLAHLSGQSESKAAEALHDLVSSAAKHAGPELAALVGKLPPEEAAKMEGLLARAATTKRNGKGARDAS